MATRQQTFGMLAVIALAFAVSSMTALRLPGLPIGLSEFILVVCMIVHIPLGFGIHGGNQPNRFVPFLFLLLVATLPGYALNITSEAIDQAGASYNLIAMVYVVLLFAYLHFGFDHGKFDLDKLVQLFVVLSALYFLIVIGLSQVEPSLVYAQDDIDELMALANADGEMELRLVGFAANPNQLALHALVVLFFVLRLRSKSSFMGTAICFLAAATVGLLAQSDAFLFAMIAMVGVSVVMGIVFNGSGMTKILVLAPAIVIGLLVVDPLAGAVQENRQHAGSEPGAFRALGARHHGGHGAPGRGPGPRGVVRRGGAPGVRGSAQQRDRLLQQCRRYRACTLVGRHGSRLPAYVGVEGCCAVRRGGGFLRVRHVPHGATPAHPLARVLLHRAKRRWAERQPCIGSAVESPAPPQASAANAFARFQQPHRMTMARLAIITRKGHWL